jgi:hypothetical protein
VIAGPSVAEERALELRGRGLPVDAVPWRTNTVLWSLVFFGLVVVMLAATFFLLERLWLPKGWLTGAAAIVTAEMLIGRRRFFGTGVESALWIGGLFAVIFGLRGEGKPEALLLFVAACAIAGVRMRNAVFGAGAACFLIAYLAARDVRTAAAALGVLISLAALVAITREVRRPSTDWLLCALILVPPVAGAIASGKRLSAAWALVYLGAAAACAVVGVRARVHAPLVGAGVHAGAAVATLVVHDLLPWRAEWQLITGGAILLAASAVLSRRLRDRTWGLVVTPEGFTRFDDTLKTAAAVAWQPRSATPSSEAPSPASGGGGRFGGAGASGDY